MVRLSGDEHLAPVQDSYAQFLKGAYRLSTLGKRFYRVICWPRRDTKTGWVRTVNEMVEATMLERWQRDPDYRSRNLIEWAAKQKIDLGALNGDVKADVGDIQEGQAAYA